METIDKQEIIILLQELQDEVENLTPSEIWNRLQLITDVINKI